MALKDFVPPTKMVKLGDESIPLRGLSLSDIASLLRPFRTELSALMSGRIDVEAALIQFPDLCANVIAYAADAPEDGSKVAKWPFGTQIDALRAVWELTVVDEEEFVKKLGVLTAGLESLAAKLPKTTGGNASMKRLSS